MPVGVGAATAAAADLNRLHRYVQNKITYIHTKIVLRTKEGINPEVAVQRWAGIDEL